MTNISIIESTLGYRDTTLIAYKLFRLLIYVCLVHLLFCLDLSLNEPLMQLFYLTRFKRSR